MSVVKKKKKKMESDSGVESDDTDDEVQVLFLQILQKNKLCASQAKPTSLYPPPRIKFYFKLVFTLRTLYST